MNTVSINTTQNIALEYEPAGLGDRIVARILDLVFCAAYLTIFVMLENINGFQIFMDGHTYITIIILVFPLLFYHLFFELWMNGQSPGKKIMGIKVVSLNGNQSSFGQYLIRWVFRVVDFWIGNGLVALITVAATAKHQRVGDLVAGTTIIKTKLRTQLQQTIYVPTVDVNYVVTYPEASNLKPRDVQLIKEIMASAYKNANGFLAFEAARKIEQVLNIKMQSEPMHFLQTLLADYNHLAS